MEIYRRSIERFIGLRNEKKKKKEKKSQSFKAAGEARNIEVWISSRSRSFVGIFDPTRRGV